ncbi:5-formyltetrahydrofolate cyclo-ligase, partial [Catenibacterium mitsuokai]
GAFHILEPSTNEHMDVKDLDVIVVPLLMFDKNHNRIGYGRGFYDRCLKKTEAITIGLAFDFQEVENTHPHPLDVSLNYIITQKGVF